jgi:hypothetical protein
MDRVKSDIVEIRVEVFFVADNVVEKSGLQEMHVKKKCWWDGRPVF